MVSPQVCSLPALTEVKESTPETATGVVWTSVEPLPKTPVSPRPQQYAVPLVVTPQV